MSDGCSQRRLSNDRHRPQSFLRPPRRTDGEKLHGVAKTGMMDQIQQFGFLPLLDSGIEGFSAEDINWIK